MCGMMQLNRRRVVGFDMRHLIESRYELLHRASGEISMPKYGSACLERNNSFKQMNDCPYSRQHIHVCMMRTVYAIDPFTQGEVEAL